MTTIAADSLHRLVKQALDSGAAATIEEAEQLFRGYRLGLRIAPEAVHSPVQQAALLTCVTLARRVFLGGVAVEVPLSVPLAVPLPFPGHTLNHAVRSLGGQLTRSAHDPALPLIDIGTNPGIRERAFHIRTAATSWRGGILPADFDLPDEHAWRNTSEASTVPLAPMLAAALAVNEAFLHVRGETAEAGQRPVGLSLWRPQPECDWLADPAADPELRFLPTRLWLLGLGHLGQSFLWALGLLRYPTSADLQLVLQDTDLITPSTESTSILTDATLVGQKKTRAMAQWADRRGFTTTIVERLFDEHFRRRDDEPAIALCGLDNALGRRALDSAGFDLVIEAGLGRGSQDFRTVRLHTLPSSRTAAEIWPHRAQGELPLDRPAYRSLLDRNVLDRCGVTLLAGKAVGAPFVGAVAASLVIAEVLRALHCGERIEVIDLDLLSPEHRVAVIAEQRQTAAFNPGYVDVRR